jgi:hypothetical protein
MKKLAITALVLVSSVAMAAPGGNSDNANQNACFGQGRSEYALLAHALGLPTVGDYASQRKGSNAEMNAAYRDACQG